MIKKVVIKNGKKYIVNTTTWEDVGGGDFGVGPGGAIGTAWMQSTDKNWYAVKVSGSLSASVVNVNQTTIGYQDNSLGSQLLACDDGKKYLVYLTGVPNAVTFTVSQSAYNGTTDPKPDLLLQSITDSNYYMLYLHNSASVIQAKINPFPYSASVINGLGY